MAQSLSNVLIHLVFSTKNRHPSINVKIEEELFKYIAGICRELECPSHKIGANDDHIHIACSLARTISISKLVENIKTGSSKWIKTKGDRFSGFAWQNGYGAFSIGQSQMEDLRRYIANQREHHRKMSFQDEFRDLLSRYDVEYDERYVCGISAANHAPSGLDSTNALKGHDTIAQGAALGSRAPPPRSPERALCSTRRDDHRAITIRNRFQESL